MRINKNTNKQHLELLIYQKKIYKHCFTKKFERSIFFNLYVDIINFLTCSDSRQLSHYNVLRNSPHRIDLSMRRGIEQNVHSLFEGASEKKPIKINIAKTYGELLL